MGEQSTEIAILDVRPADSFVSGHRKGAVNIPLEELASRIHELPSPHVPLVIFDLDDRRARWAASRLRSRGRDHGRPVSGVPWLESGTVERGPSTCRLWQPHALLIRALSMAETAWGQLGGRRALDIACGTGRDAVFMALRGLDVEAIDFLPDAIARCRDLAARNSVRVHARVQDVESNLLEGVEPSDIVTCFNFLHRPLLPAITDAVKPGGFAVYETFTVEQRRQFGKPRHESHLLRPGELRDAFAHWRIEHYQESLVSPRRFVASLIAFKPPTAP